MKVARSGLALLSALALVHSQAASAQACVSEAEVSALFVYAMPPALESARNSCDGRLKPQGFFAQNGKQLIGQYAALQNETWPKAKRALLLFAGSKKPAGKASRASSFADLDANRLLGNLPDDVVRPLVDAVIVEKVAEQVKPEHCRNIERVAAAIAPIDPRSAAALLATVMSLVGVKEPSICSAE